MIESLHLRVIERDPGKAYLVDCHFEGAGAFRAEVTIPQMPDFSDHWQQWPVGSLGALSNLVDEIEDGQQLVSIDPEVTQSSTVDLSMHNRGMELLPPYAESLKSILVAASVTTSIQLDILTREAIFHRKARTPGALPTEDAMNFWKTSNRPRGALTKKIPLPTGLERLAVALGG